jgi:glucokinase
MGYPRLLGDVGGTNARWAWQDAPGRLLTHVSSYPCAEFASIRDVISHYLDQHRLPAPQAVAFGTANPVTGDFVSMTNHHWQFSIRELQQQLGSQTCLVMNDFAALAASLPALTANELRAVGNGSPVAGEPMAVIGPGTGLGVATVITVTEGRHVVMPGEGGHVTLAAADDYEAEILARMRRQFGHVSAERALSGSGLTALHDAVCALNGVPAAGLDPATITALGLEGSDVKCVEVLRLFTSFLGNVAGNLALTQGARGGIFIGGGIVPRLGAFFEASAFRERFEAKGRFAGYLAQIPTWVITAHSPGLLGAARALDDTLDGTLS